MRFFTQYDKQGQQQEYITIDEQEYKVAAYNGDYTDYITAEQYVTQLETNFQEGTELKNAMYQSTKTEAANWFEDFFEQENYYKCSWNKLKKEFLQNFGNMEAKQDKNDQAEDEQEDEEKEIQITEKMDEWNNSYLKELGYHTPEQKYEFLEKEELLHLLPKADKQYLQNKQNETKIEQQNMSKTTKEETKQFVKRIGQKFQHYIELESSNTCVEASTEFTPDFLLPTINNSKYDVDDDQTEQFGIDTEKQDYQTDTISLIINEQDKKIDTLTFNSTEKENYDSLDLDIVEQGQ